jgi:pSer/pThr/pTyr-binding forkhead associated (FHA) protein
MVFIFEDMGSSNGSFINNVRVTQGVQQFLNEGDMLRLGKTVMTLIKG